MRAFVNGRVDLMQAEAVADLIDSVTPLQARAAFDQLNGTLTREIAAIDAALFDLIARLEASVDFPDEGYHFIEPGSVATAIDGILARTRAAAGIDAQAGRVVREGLQVAIVGEPNVGKSSLFNALVGSARAIVTDVPGTTRDLVTETIDLDGLRVTLVDTAGARDTADVIESEGVARSYQAAKTADLTLVVRRPSPAPGPIGQGWIFGSPNIRSPVVSCEQGGSCRRRGGETKRFQSPLRSEWAWESCENGCSSALDVETLSDRPGDHKRAAHRPG